MNFIKRIKSAEYIFIISNENPRGGSVSTALYFRDTYKNVEVISRDYKGAWFKVLICFFLAKSPAIINSLYLFNFYDILIFCALKKNSVIYLHEGPAAVTAFKKNNRLKYVWFSILLKKRSVACISEWQMKWLEKKTKRKNGLHLLYNSTFLNSDFVIEPDVTYVIMVGYFMERKGVSFFSELSDYAKEKNPSLRFVWVGGGKTSGLYFSKNVVWVGEQKNVGFFYSIADVFFLSSIDEPFGLVCAEALMYNLRCVVYKETGFAEVIQGLSGCECYKEYDIESAFSALQKSLESSIDPQKVQKRLRQYLNIKNFKERLDKII